MTRTLRSRPHTSPLHRLGFGLSALAATTLLTACPAKPKEGGDGKQEAKAEDEGKAEAGAEATGGAEAVEAETGGGDEQAELGEFDPEVKALLAAQQKAEEEAKAARGKCPEGAKPLGKAPPDGFEQWCERMSADGKPSGVREGLYETFFENGKVHQEIFFKGGMEHGHFITFYEDGTKEEQGDYKFGVQVGPWETWTHEGQPHTIVHYDDAGKMHGEMITFYDSGKRHIVSTYASGKMEGPYKSYYESGQVAREGQYVEGRPSGEWTEYTPDGEVEATETYENGLPVAHSCKKGEEAEEPTDDGGKLQFCKIDGEKQGPVYVLDDKGRVVATGLMIDGKKDGLWTEYDAEKGHGEVKSITSYTAGQRDGMYMDFHEDGQTIKWSGEYIDGQKQGIWTEHFADESVSQSGDYLDDEKSGEWVVHFDNGKVAAEANYWHDEKEGLAVYYWPNGNVRARGEYKGGQRRGEWLLTTEDAKKTEVETCAPVCEEDLSDLPS